MSSILSAAAALYHLEKEQMRKEIIDLFSGRCKKSMRLSSGVRRFRDNLVVKQRLFAGQDEYNNQLKAFHLLDPNVVRVPRPIDFFTHKYPGDRNSQQFIVMEFAAAGQTQLGELSDHQLDQVADVIRYLATFKSTIPGALTDGHGGLYGILFEGDPPPESGSIQKLNEWIHTRRTLYPDTTVKSFVDFGQFELVLCHLDIAPRNILWPIDGGALWLLDWESAAFLPRLFENFQHEVSPRDVAFHDEIISRLEPLSERETELKTIFAIAWDHSIRAY